MMAVLYTSRKSRWKNGMIYTSFLFHTVQFVILYIVALQSVIICAEDGDNKPSPKPITEPIRYKECCMPENGEDLSSGPMEICPKPRCSIDYCHNGQQKTSSDGQQKSDTQDIYIGGLFPLSSTTSFSKNGRSNLEAACLALEHINRQQFIPGYRLLMYYNDTQCHTGVGADALFDQLYRKPTMTMLLGCSCSQVSKHVAQIIPYWNLTMISYASTSVALTEKGYSKNFFRTVTPDTFHNAARSKFIKNFNWSEVATLIQEEELYSLAMSRTIQHFQTDGVNITVISTQSFVDDPAPHIEKLIETDARIIFGSFEESAARRVFCEAYQRGMYGAKYVWFLLGWYQQRWWEDKNDTSCTPDQLAKVVDGYFAVDSLNTNVGDIESLSGLTSEEFEREFASRGLPHISNYAPNTYDAAWTIALTLKTAMERMNMTGERYMDADSNSSLDLSSTLENFTYQNAAMNSLFLDILGDTRFIGVSGPVSFHGHDRYGVSSFRQNQDNEMKLVALYFPENMTLDFDAEGTTAIRWAGSGPPSDRLIVVDKRLHIAPAAYVATSSLALLGILMALVFLSFNIRYRKLKYIKLSSPNLNNLLILGCIMVYISILLLGVESEMIGVDIFTPLCTIRSAFLATGFSMAFGSMFVKTYRVYHIITHATSRVIKRKMLHESTLFLMIGVLLLIDVILFAVWVIFDPMERHEKRLPTQRVDDYNGYVPVLEICESNRITIWLGAVYSYKGLLLLFGIFLAWETRKVKIPALNDSHYIVVCVYNVVIMSVLAVVVSNLLNQGKFLTTAYVLMNMCIFVTTTATLCFLFVPKVYAIRMIGAGADPVTKSVGLEIKGRTRRFVTDETTELKESIYRAEVQLRSNKKDSLKLDVKIAELEEHLRLLESGEYIGYNSADPNHHRRMKLLLHLPETAIQEQSTSEEDDDDFEFIDKCKRPLQRDDSGRHSLDSRTTDDTSETISIWNHEEKSQWKPMICNTELQRSVSDKRTSRFKRDSQKCHTISTEEEDESDEPTFGQGNLCCDDHDCEDTGCCADADVRSSDEEGMEAEGLLKGSNRGFLQGDTDDDGEHRELEANVISDGDGEKGQAEAEVDSLVVEMQDVQMRLLQLNGKSHMIYYV